MDKEFETRLEKIQQLLDERAAAREAAKKKAEAEQKERWDFYHDQLAKGNSNSGGGTRRKRLVARPFRFR